ncbi:MAG: long-chain-fatty-acid--CoA ligase [Alphaproteobacteria bacterium]|nr:long-chain-fatty-acid--CoA ligase [Alphaproteobacteria bacterium]
MSEFYGCRTLGEVLTRQARARPEAVAMIFEERVTRYGELEARAHQVANALAAMGLGPRDRVAYLGKNSDLFFELLFGAAKGNVVLVPMNWRLALPEMRTVLHDAAVSVLFVGRAFGEVAAQLQVPGLERFVSMDGADTAWPDFEAWRDAQSSEPQEIAIDPNDTALQLYTSGTTGLPKGVELTSRNIMTFLDCYESPDVLRLTPDDVSLVSLPVFHFAGVGVGLMCLAQGARTVILEEVNVARIVESIERHRLTAFVMVPAVILMVVQHCETQPADVSSVRHLTYGASPIAEDVLRRAMRVFANAGFCQVYGSTESGAVATFLAPEHHDPARGKLRSCGHGYPGIGLRVVDPDGNALPSGEIGEIVVRGPCVMKGYWRNPQATAAAFFPDGWLRTGDAGYFDEAGFLYIYDRVKDMIVTGAENVYPAEVENALFGHPAIADAAVIGVPDARWGEAVKAIVVLRPGVEATAEDIIGYARERIAGFKLPKSVDFVEALPRNPTGKVLRRQLREPYWRGHERRVS